MTGVLHLQTRAYPLHHGAIAFATGQVSVPGRGEVRLSAGSLGSHAYNPEPTVEADLTGLVRGAVALPGTEIVSCRARLITAGTVLLVYALRHQADLSGMDAYRLADFDATVNRELRDADSAVIGEALYAAVEAGVLRDLVLRPGHVAGTGPTSVDRRAVRYNCHFVTARPPWAPDSRVPDLPLGPRCRVLLPYTYAWEADPDTPLDEIVTMLEPADIATAQLSVVFSATIGGRRILDELSRSAPGPLRGEDLRRFLDRVWASYHQLDFYRLESAQDHRATYLAARETIGLDRAHGRAGELLDYVGSSLLAESSRRTQLLDSRLNRVAAALTVVVAAAFAVDLAAFMFPAPGWATRVAVVSGVTLLSVAALAATVLSARERRRVPQARRIPRARRVPRARPPAPPPDGSRAADDPPRIGLR
ncbi:MAG: hypothetical protein GEV12_17295 [Micromonosporaceae bacterium]|nr:hypothetical protein [Micromonosporaceae bacterium]